MPKNIVILSDGTGQSYTATKSNVLRLYEFLLKDSPSQVAMYNPGIATSPVPLGMNPVKQIRHLMQLGFGLGLMDDVTILYKFLMNHYQPGDTIFIFGFSRGAFTVRALAALVHICGLLRRNDVHLVPDVIALFRTSENRIKKAGRTDSDYCGAIDHARADKESVRFKSTFSQTCHIDFMGLWDTVKAYGVIYPLSFPCLRHNPSVGCVRHAMAINERRSLFQVTSWGDMDEGWGRIKEVWFCGDHTDVGGGHDDEDTRLADITLDWMLGEATNRGLLLDECKLEEVKKLKYKDNAALPQAHDLNRGSQWFFSILPRLELDNSEYPPVRPFRWPSGMRHPMMDREHPCVLYHVTVPEAEKKQPRALKESVEKNAGYLFA